MNKSRVTDAATEPVTLEDMEKQLHISSGWDSDKVNRNIKAARQMVEEDTDRSLISQTWLVTLDHWPSSDVIFLPRGKVQSITELKYTDTEGDQQTLAVNTDFKLHNKGDVARITPVTSWPSVYPNRKEVIEITYLAGYGGVSNVPSDLKEAIIAKATELYESGQVSMEKMYQSLINAHRIIFNYAIND